MLRLNRWRVALTVGLAVPTVWIGVTFWRASRAAHDSATGIAGESQLRFTSTRLDLVNSAGVEWIGAPAVFTDFAIFQGSIYISGPAGLLVYDAGGTLRARYRPGLELPSAPLGGMSVGTAADSSGRELFIATSGEGLLAFDGSHFRQIRAEDEAARKLTAVLPLGDGRVLMGTASKGVLVYDGKRLAAFHPSLSGLHVTALAGDTSSLWTGTLDRGVYHWHAGELDRIAEGQGLPDPQVLSLEAAGDRAFAGTPMGIAEFQGGRFTRVLARGFFAAALLARGETLAAGSLDEGVVEIPLSSAPARSVRPRLHELGAQVHKLLDMDGTLYALAGDGLYALDPRSPDWRRVLERESAVLADRNISALAFDPTGRLWVGYFDRGLDIVNGARAMHLENDTLFCVNRIVSDAESQTTAVATANGVALFDGAGNQRQTLRQSDGLIADHVTDVVLRAGGMTLATPAGLTFIDSSGTHSVSDFHGLVNTHVYALGASGSELLAGTLGGLSVLRGGVVRASYTTANSGLKQNWITAIVPVGPDWFVGTYGAGVLRLDPSGQWQSFADLKPPVEINPNAMLVTPSRVYAGSLGRGLYIYDRASARWTARTAGLPSANVTALAARAGELYVGTDNGLVRVPERSLP
jgi:ligand-binding sensor domain-containing protein